MENYYIIYDLNNKNVHNIRNQKRKQTIKISTLDQKFIQRRKVFMTNCKNLIPSSIQRNGINPSGEQVDASLDNKTALKCSRALGYTRL